MYFFRPNERLALNALARRRDGIKVVILEGPPGTGKTSLGEAYASEIGAEVVYYLCHHWTTEEEMFLGVDIGAVAAGVNRPEEAYRPGFLLRAVEASTRGPVVVIIDELDKAPERVEALLLDFLQTARVHGPRGEVWQGNTENMVVFITSNAIRPLMESTMRRGFRIQMDFLPPHVEADILRKETGAPPSVIRVVVRMANVIRQQGATAVSLQEMRHLLVDLYVAQSAQDAEILIRGWLVKEPEDWKALAAEFKNAAAILWGEWKRGQSK